MCRTLSLPQVASILRDIMSKGGGNTAYRAFVMHKELSQTCHSPFSLILASAGSASAPQNMPLPVAHVSFCIYTSQNQY